MGRVHPHLEVKIVDPVSGVTTPRGVAGELCTRGYSVMLGYWQQPDKTAEAIDAAGWMHTGDLATMDADGYVNITGRIKDMLIRGGENISPREIEEFLHTHPAVRDVQVIGVPDERLGEEVMAWIELVDGATAPTPEDLRAVRLGPAGALQAPPVRAHRRRLPDDGQREGAQGRDAAGLHRDARPAGDRRPCARVAPRPAHLRLTGPHRGRFCTSRGSCMCRPGCCEMGKGCVVRAPGEIT